MNKIIISIEWLEAFSVNGVPLADIGLLVTWLLIAIMSLGVQWPLHPWKRRVTRSAADRD
jgi:hypothetical protein